MPGVSEKELDEREAWELTPSRWRKPDEHVLRMIAVIRDLRKYVDWLKRENSADRVRLTNKLIRERNKRKAR
jgi:hypothetical protein